MPINSLSISNYRGFGPGSVIANPGEFSDGINLFVGPNGAGKTTLINALCVLFNRDVENSQGSKTYAGKANHECLEYFRFNTGNPWEVKADVDFSACEVGKAVKGTLVMGGRWKKPKEWSLDGEHLITPVPTGEDTTQSALFNRGFSIGWPRKIRYLEQGAVLGKLHKKPNSDFYNHPGARSGIDQDALEYLGVDLKDVDLKPVAKICIACKEPMTPASAPCKECGNQYKPEGVYCIEDENGRFLLEGSDGKIHFFYLILEFRKHRWPTSFFLEEPDLFMHPGLQKRFIEYVGHLAETQGHQFFITTHSPYLLNATTERIVREDGPKATDRIFRIHYRKQVAVEPLNVGEKAKSWRALADLGHRPSDVMHPNGIIWVEGPSDRIYLMQWLAMYSREEYDKLKEAEKTGRRPAIRWGVDCEILFYGGSLLSHLALTLKRRLGLGQFVREKLVELSDAHPNAALLMDRDGGVLAKGGKAKVRIMREFRENDRIAWITQGYSIEGYIRETLRAECGIPKNVGKTRFRRRKVKAAEDYIKLCKGKTLAEVIEPGSDLGEILKELYDVILKWQ